MKKLASIFLVCIMIFSIFAVSGFAANEKTGLNTISSNAENIELESMFVLSIKRAFRQVNNTFFGGFLKLEKAIKVTDVKLSNSSIQTNVGKSSLLMVSIEPQNAPNDKIIWKSADWSIASVDDNGIVKARSVGTTNIYAIADDGGFYDSCTVSVSRKNDVDGTIPCTSLTLSKETVSLKCSEQTNVAVAVAPSNTTDTLKISVRDETIATAKVSNDMSTVIIKGIKAGTTEVNVGCGNIYKVIQCVVTENKTEEDTYSSGKCGENLTWYFYPSTGILQIKGFGAMYNYSYSGNRTPWYLFRSEIKSVILPDGLTSIGNYAFFDCPNLASVTFGKTGKLTNIGYSAFNECTSLASVTIPDSVTIIDAGAFWNCTSLKSVIFGENSQLKSVSRNAFEDCTNLTSITIPDSVTSIGVGAFDDTAYYNNKSNWENNALYSGKHLIGVKTVVPKLYIIKDGTKTIAGGAFHGCTGLTSIVIPDSVTSIGDCAFYGLENLVRIVLGKASQLTSIGGEAFYKCTSLENITIPNSVTYIGEKAFSGCNKLTDIYYMGTKAEWDKINVSTAYIGVPDATIHAIGSCATVVVTLYAEGSDETIQRTLLFEAGETIDDFAVQDKLMSDYGINAMSDSISETAEAGASYSVNAYLLSSYATVTVTLYSEGSSETTLKTLLFAAGETINDFAVQDKLMSDYGINAMSDSINVTAEAGASYSVNAYSVSPYATVTVTLYSEGSSETTLKTLRFEVGEAITAIEIGNRLSDEYGIEAIVDDINITAEAGGNYTATAYA